jgi:broad specificity phosphatase PhoE
MSHRVWLVRHGEPAETVGVDPALTDLGRAQASALVSRLSPCALRTSPLRRARETAEPLAVAWAITPVVDATFRELPSDDIAATARREWLRVALAGDFAALGPEQRAWRDAVVAAVRATQTATVITTHAVVINAVTGHCEGDDAVLAWVPAHASITEIAVDDVGALTLVGRGDGRPGGLVV